MSELAYLGSFVHSGRPTLSKEREASIGDLSATGRTVAEAKANLAERVAYALTGDYEPIVIPHGGFIALAWRTIDGGWKSIIRRPDGSHGCTTYGWHREDRAKVDHDLRRTFAQYLDGAGMDGAAVAYCDQIDDLNSYRAWQAAYAIAMADGDPNPRAFADTRRNPMAIRAILADKCAPFGPSPYCRCDGDTHTPYCPDFVAEQA